MTFAAFDLDGTLYTGHITVGLSRHHLQHRVKRVPLLLYMASHLAMWPLWRVGLVSELAGRQAWIRDMAWLVRGWTEAQAQTAFQWVATQYVLPRVRPDVLQRLEEHQAAGHRVLLVSGTLAPMLQAIGRAVGVEETVGTVPLIENGRYTGATLPPTCQGPGKPALLEEHLGSAAPALWERSYAYGDSFTDLELLQRVGHPVTVYPDPQLAAHARDHGWEILSRDEPFAV